MNWSLRPYEAGKDDVRVAALFTWNDGFQWSAADVAANVARWPDEKPMARTVAERDGEVVGYARCCLIAENPRGSFAAEVMVDPEAQRHGIGSKLLDEVEAFARDKGARCVTGLVREAHAKSLETLKARGYQARTLYFSSELDPRGFERDRFGAHLERVQGEGYEVRPLAGLPAGEETDRALYQCVHESDQDAPFMDYFGYVDYASYRRMVLGAPWFDRSCYMVAMKAGRIVGTSSVNRGSIEFNGEMFVEYTGVLREHRGRGLATAMKVLALDRAKAIGGTRVRTENNTDNPAMRAVNRKLGFVETPGQWLVVKEL